MNLHYNTEGFIFKKEDGLEADRIFSVFTKDFGRIEIFAKAIRKIDSKLKGNIEIFSLSKIEFIQGRNRKTLTDTALIEKFKSIENVPEKLEIAYRISDILDDFIRGEEKDDDVFDLLNDILNKLNDFKFSLADARQELIYLYFFWNFIFVMGYGPELSKCSVCAGKLDPDALYFSNKEGGIICKSCHLAERDGIKIESSLVKILRLLLKKDWEILSKLKVENNTARLLKEISDNYYNYIRP